MFKQKITIEIEFENGEVKSAVETIGDNYFEGKTFKVLTNEERNRLLAVVLEPIWDLVTRAEEVLALDTERTIAVVLTLLKGRMQVYKSSFIEIAEKYLNEDDGDVMPWVRDWFKRKEAGREEEVEEN